MNLKTIYIYEIELKDGTIITNHNNFKNEDVVRVSFISSIFPRHDIIFTDFKFVKRFSRNFMGIDCRVKNILHCVVTDRFRFYLKAGTGAVLILDKDYELYL